MSTESRVGGETPGPPGRIRIVLVDDHAVIRDGLAAMLERGVLSLG